MRIGFMEESRTSGNANKPTLPMKLPRISPVSESTGKTAGYKRQDKKIKKVLSIGIESSNEAWFSNATFFASQPPS